MTKEIISEEDHIISIAMVTYNHEKYIAQAIESVMMQETNFCFHLFIGDDSSTDDTQRICLSYKEKYPDKIKLILHESNIGMIHNIKETFEATFNSGAKYIAVLEGDDYWIDKFKLQKQVDFLENHPDFSICITNARILKESTNSTEEFFHENYFLLDSKSEYGLDDLLYINFIPNLTCVFRNKIRFPVWFTKVYPGDWQMHLLSAKNGKIGFINDYTAVYRHHDTAVSTANTPIDNCKQYIRSSKIIFWKFNFNSKIILLKTLGRLYLELAMLNRYKGNIRKHNHYRRISNFFIFANKFALRLRY